MLVVVFLKDQPRHLVTLMFDDADPGEQFMPLANIATIIGMHGSSHICLAIPARRTSAAGPQAGKTSLWHAA